MRRLLLGAMLVTGCTGGSAPDAAPPPERPAAAAAGAATGQGQPAVPSLRSWTARSADGRVVLTQAPTDAGCRVEATAAGATAWHADACAATGYDLVFVAPDGERWLVLLPQPDRQGSAWSAAVVAVFYRRGVAERRVEAAELVAAERISQLERGQDWLVGSGSGEAPHYAEGGAGVSLRVAGEETLTLGFGGEGVPGRHSRPAAAPAPVAASAEAARRAEAGSGPSANSVWSWEDDQGGLHYSRWATLPEKARRVARPASGQISTVHVEAPRLGGGSSDWSHSSWGAAEPAKGPRLNGLTDAERARMAKAAALAAALKRQEEEDLYAKMRERNATLGGGPVVHSINSAKQECARVGDIVECRDAKPVCKTVNGRTECSTPQAW